ncbi:DnaJ family domain-containing protein [Kytococcus sedentarius]|uniref:DnaJ family domain-containing protein n=1 Tax=Kytococcus sedentarius TaxID=1276 RepID=UPI00194F1935|nr:DnaJ family domain-containing protein [Kytococcus sedentarius]QRO87701.1 DUF1992 domain-containing protein [Kytococcus sedentarius]
MSDPDRPAEHPGGTEPEPRSRPLKAHHVQTVVDKAIEQAQREGAFDDLPGAGKPLHLSSSDDPEWWVKGEEVVGRWREAAAAREQGGRGDHDVAPATTTDHADDDASPEGGNRAHGKPTRRWWAPWRR